MIRSDLVARLATAKDIPLAAAEKIVHEMFKYIQDTLVAGGRVEIRGFGSFETRDGGGYQARNPKTGEPVEIPLKRHPFFKTGKELKDRIMG